MRKERMNGIDLKMSPPCRNYSMGDNTRILSALQECNSVFRRFILPRKYVDDRILSGNASLTCLIVSFLFVLNNA